MLGKHGSGRLSCVDCRFVFPSRLIHLSITILFQYTIMRPLEKLAGCIRVMIIYVVSGFVGSLASALFLRDYIQVGPGGGQFAILACYLSELFLGWRSLKRPWMPFSKIAICLSLLFTVGLLPLVDNYSQLFGFLTGFMLNMIVFPDVRYKRSVRHFVVVTASLASTIALFIVLITLFYAVPLKTCASCK
jgi:membrane associated rhomboid family serine protease